MLMPEYFATYEKDREKETTRPPLLELFRPRNIRSCYYEMLEFETSPRENKQQKTNKQI